MKHKTGKKVRKDSYENDDDEFFNYKFNRKEAHRLKSKSKVKQNIKRAVWDGDWEDLEDYR